MTVLGPEVECHFRWAPKVEHKHATMVCQISRGEAPAKSIAWAATEARRRCAGYTLITGMPAVEAKNAAVNVALEHGVNLLLIEDDILAPAHVWDRACQPLPSVRLAATNCRNGISNTRYNGSGRVLYSGTVFVAIPHDVLLAMSQPIFIAHDFDEVDDCGDVRLVPRGPNEHGRNSDVWFWYQLAQLNPTPEVEVIGQVSHLVHDMNRDGHELARPSKIMLA